MSNTHSSIISSKSTRPSLPEVYQAEASPEWLCYEDGAGYPWGLEELADEAATSSIVPAGLGKYGVHYLTARAAQMKQRVRLVMTQGNPVKSERPLSDRRSRSDQEYADQFMANMLLSTYDRRASFGRRADDLAPYMH